MMLIVAVRFFGISRAGLRYAERYINHDITLRILSKLRVLVYQAIEPLLPQGVGRFSQGQLFGRLTEDIETLQFFYLKAIAAPLTAGLVLVGSSLWLWQFSPPAAVVLAVTLIVGGVLIPYAIKQRSAQTAQQTARLRETLNSQLVDFIKGIGDLQGAAQAQAYRRRLLTNLAEFSAGTGSADGLAKSDHGPHHLSESCGAVAGAGGLHSSGGQRRTEWDISGDGGAGGLDQL